MAQEPITHEQQIACVRRELAMRKNVYPAWIKNGRMKQEKADHEIAALQAVHDALTKGHPEWDLIEQLREPEGHSVTLVCDNPDFNGQPNAKVLVCGDWTGWEERTFTGETVLAALKAALDERAEIG
jgi:hypothetical protein